MSFSVFVLTCNFCGTIYFNSGGYYDYISGRLGYCGRMVHCKGEGAHQHLSTQLALFYRLSDRVLVRLDGAAFLEPIE